MNFKLILEIDRNGIRFENEKEIVWRRIKSIEKRQNSTDSFIDFVILDNQNKESIKSYNTNDLFIRPERVVSLCTEFKKESTLP